MAENERTEHEVTIEEITTATREKNGDIVSRKGRVINNVIFSGFVESVSMKRPKYLPTAWDDDVIAVLAHGKEIIFVLSKDKNIDISAMKEMAFYIIKGKVCWNNRAQLFYVDAYTIEENNTKKGVIK